MSDAAQSLMDQILEVPGVSKITHKSVEVLFVYTDNLTKEDEYKIYTLHAKNIGGYPDGKVSVHLLPTEVKEENDEPICGPC